MNRDDNRKLDRVIELEGFVREYRDRILSVNAQLEFNRGKAEGRRLLAELFPNLLDDIKGRTTY